MLQWMGGSRRNVATVSAEFTELPFRFLFSFYGFPGSCTNTVTPSPGGILKSRKSTLKRQKQYFEQRRRQQQQNSGVEEGTTVNSGSKRSLDILSLLDMPSTLSHRPSARASSSNDLSRPENPPAKGDRSGGFRSGECHVRRDPLLRPADNEESRAPAGCRMETVSKEKEFVTFPNGRAGGVKDMDSTISMQNSAPYPYRKAENRSVLLDAAHQSELSIFDLLVADEPSGAFEGKPAREDHVAFSVEGLGKVGAKTPDRSPQPPTRDVKRAVSSKWKDAKRANVTESRNAMFGDFELELDEMIQDIGMPLSGSLSKIYRQNRCNEFEERLSPPSDYKQYEGRSLRTGNSLLNDRNNEKDKWNDAGLLEGRKQFVSQKSWLSPICGDYTDFMDDEYDAAYAFHGPDRWEKNRNFQESTERFNFRDGARYRAAETTFDFMPDPFRPNWSGPLQNDERQAMSSLSEESCSTAAVRSKTNKMPRQSSTTGCGRIDPNTVSRFEVKGDPAIIWDDICEGNVYRPGECSRQPIMSKFRSTLEHNSPAHYKSGEDSCWPFEEGYKSSHLDLDTEARKFERKQPFSCYNLWTDSGMGECLASERDLDDQFEPVSLKPGICPLSRTSEIENLVRGKPSGGNQAPSLSQHMFESPKTAFCSDFGLKGRLPMSSDDLSPNQLADLGRPKRSGLELEEPNYDCGNACKPTMTSSRSQNCAEFCDAKDGSLETLASMNVPDESDSNEPKQEFDDAPCLDRKMNSVKSSDGAADRRMMMSRVNGSHIESSSTIMLGTCIFQLVCAQKVAKEAPLHGKVAKVAKP